jgi:very-short-patch-repair endonuclease
MVDASRRTSLAAAVADEERAAEHGVLSRDVAAALPETRRRLRSKAWKTYGTVVVTHNGPLDEMQRGWVAVLRAGPGAVLAAAWAMREHGVSLEVPDRPQVVVPAYRSWPRIPGVDIRRSRLLGPEHVHPVRQPPVFRLARATLDATSLCRRPDDVRALLCAPVQQRRLRVSELRDCVALLGPLTGRSVVLRTLDDLELGAQSVHELRFTRGLRRRHLPMPDHQRLCHRPGGKAYLDCWWERYRLHVEIDGLAHLWVSNWLADLARTNELAIGAPATRLRFAGFQLLEQEDQVFEQVVRALVAGGWTGR